MKRSRIADVLVLANVTADYATYSLMTYLTNDWGLNSEQAAKIVNCWSGISYILVPLFAFTADTFTGHYAMIAITTISYPMGLGFLTMSTPFFSSIGGTQKVLFSIGLVFISIGNNGYDASALSFIQEQITSTENKQPKIGVRILMFSVLLTIILYFPKASVLQFGIPAILTLSAAIFFWIGSSSYNKKAPLWSAWSPLTAAFRVDMASINKLLVMYREDRRKRYFGKDAIILPNQAGEYASPMPIEKKKEVDVMPLWITILTFIICGFVSSFGETIFQNQATAPSMNSQIGKLNISLEIILLVYEMARFFFEKLAVMLEPLPRFGMEALFLALICCTSASSVYRRMIQVEMAKSSMSVFWLLPQYLLLAGVDSFLQISFQEFFKARLTPSMQIYSLPFGYAIKGFGFIASSVSMPAMRNIVVMDKLYLTLATVCATVLVLHPVVMAMIHLRKTEDHLPEQICDESDKIDIIELEEKKEETRLYPRSLTSTYLKKMPSSQRQWSLPVTRTSIEENSGRFKLKGLQKEK